MAQITKSYKFEAAHQLYGHKGKCADLHGHSYIVDITIGGPILDEAYERNALTTDYGFVLDFGDLDDIVHPLIDHLDHTFLNTNPYMIIPRTTAEFIACWFVMKLYIDENLPVVEVRVHETASSYARATINDVRDSAMLRNLWGLGEGPIMRDLRAVDVPRVSMDNEPDELHPQAPTASEGR